MGFDVVATATGSFAGEQSLEGELANVILAGGEIAVDGRSLVLLSLGPAMSGRLEFITPVDLPPPVIIVNGDFVLIGGTEYSISAGNTVFVGSTVSQTEAKVQTPLPTLTASELYVVSDTAPGAGESFVVTMRKEGVDTAITATISGSATSGSGSSTVAFTAGQKYSVSITSSSGAATATLGFSIKTVFQTS